jgi:SNF2 family DNA or RNA helicase
MPSKRPCEVNVSTESTYTLRGFQQEAVDKFIDVKAVLIGDDMGLGKTVEAIDLDWQRRLKGCPSFMKPYNVGHAKHRPTLILTRMSVV